MSKRIKFGELSKSEQDAINQIYGINDSDLRNYQQQRILYLEELSQNERLYFDTNNIMSANQIVQKLYKISGNLLTLRFNRAVNNLVQNTEELRVNFCQLPDRILKVYFGQRTETPPVVYRNLKTSADIDSDLKHIMEADMRKRFDLRHDSLIRFSVFNTAHEEYAVLVTTVKLLENTFNIKNFFREVMELELLPEEMQRMDTFTSEILSESVKNYWAKMLENLPNLPVLPYLKTISGLYSQQVYYSAIPADIMSDLRGKAKSNKMMLMTILELAWAILLQDFNKSQDVAFATLVPSKKETSTNMIPVRFIATGQATLQELVNQQFKQLLVSQPYASLASIMPNGKHFNHFLDFNDFLKEELTYSTVKAQPDGQLVVQNLWSTHSTSLGVYFHYSEYATKVSILYDENKFLQNFGEKLTKRYILILQQMLTDWNLPYDTFKERLSNRLEQIEEETEQEDTRAYLKNFISQLELLQGMPVGTLQKIFNASTLATYFEGDRISGADIENYLLFVVEGKLVRSIEAGDGWYNTLDIIKANGWVNETALLEKRTTHMSAEVLTEKAVVMNIHVGAMNNIFKESPAVEYKILQHILKNLEKYQRLWIQS